MKCKVQVTIFRLKYSLAIVHHYSISASRKIDDAENLDLLMPMYNLQEYISNYFDTISSLRFYSKDEATNFNANIEGNNAFKSSKSFLK